MNATDKELTERAARAAGIDLKWSSEPDLAPRRTDTWEAWNPLDDDGDALGLAVKLGIGVSFLMHESYSGENNVARARHFDFGEIDEHSDDNGGIEAATRRAIVRAASRLAP